ncbi:FAD-binding oxidoreductase [Ferrimonas pelagia]|uniref:FAD-binding oxidoreductase n=1 Tax=Ferrimonas pelagia TaxID=1177826 RepID=A0ABP9F933_9GAMM
MNTLDPNLISEFRSVLAGPVFTPDNDAYNAVRQLWNATADKHPALIVQCWDRGDVIAALKFARQHQLEIAVRGAGHNIAGNASCDGGLMIDLSNMQGIELDQAAERVYVQPGVILEQLDAATQAHGLAVPIGINSTTGIAGLTLGGGFGWLTRQYGMTVDSLVGVELITVDGEILYANEAENDELFWALRGGGGNFGIVTRFDFSLVSVGPDVLAGLMVFPLAQADAVLKRYAEWILTTPLTFNAWVVLRAAPPLPFLDASLHGTPVAVIPICHTGDLASGEKLVDTLRSFGEPVGEHIGVMPFVDWQQAFDPMLTAGARNYWKTHNFTQLSPELLQLAVDFADQQPGPECEVFFACIAGVSNEVAPEAMAWQARDAKFVMNIHARWQDIHDDGSHIDWARALFNAAQPYASAGAYVNFMTEEEGGRIESAYADNYQRLVAVKQAYDPDNLLHFNQNIKPD